MKIKLIVLNALLASFAPLAVGQTTPSEQADVALSNKPDPSSLLFTPNPALSDKIRADLVNRLRVNSGDDLASMVDETFQKTNIMLLFKQLVAPKYGMDPHNLGDALCVAWISSWSVANKVIEDTPVDNAKAACLQIRSMASTSPGVADMNDAAKQDLAETLIYEGLLLELAAISARDHGVGDTDEIAESARIYALNNLGVDMMSMSLSPLGFQKQWDVTQSQAPADAVPDGHNPQ